MAANRIRYKQMERYMTYALIANATLFLSFLLFSGLGIAWLKVTTAVLAIVLSALCLGYLYLSGELLRKRSLWMSVASAAIILCIIFSLLLNFPSPNTAKTINANSGSETAYFCATEHFEFLI